MSVLPTVHPTTLPDGRMATIRALTGADADALSAAVQHADSRDLRRRFMGSPPPIAVLLERLRAADGVHDVGLGAFDPAGRLIGVAQFDRWDDEPEAELAIEVARDWQRAGLGGVLLHELCRVADGCGITRLTAVYFADNMAIIQLLHSTGHCRWVSTASGASTAELDVRQVLSAPAGTPVVPAG
jgi:RimJ/RimL family protein N-acetyltransferase